MGHLPHERSSFPLVPGNFQCAHGNTAKHGQLSILPVAIAIKKGLHTLMQPSSQIEW
ncbi:MAG: hypothetical protein ACI97A_003855 [Planctomycetota bacterium]|jgi:hypothetical protein